MGLGLRWCLVLGGARQNRREVDRGGEAQLPPPPNYQTLETPNLTHSNHSETFASHEPEFTSLRFWLEAVSGI